jgi:hypothetical protein
MPQCESAKVRKYVSRSLRGCDTGHLRSRQASSMLRGALELATSGLGNHRPTPASAGLTGTGPCHFSGVGPRSTSASAEITGTEPCRFSGVGPRSTSASAEITGTGPCRFSGAGPGSTSAFAGTTPGSGSAGPPRSVYPRIRWDHDGGPQCADAERGLPRIRGDHSSPDLPFRQRIVDSGRWVRRYSGLRNGCDRRPPRASPPARIRGSGEAVRTRSSPKTVTPPPARGEGLTVKSRRAKDFRRCPAGP